MVSNERSSHEVTICEISKPYPLYFKSRSKGQSQGHNSLYQMKNLVMRYLYIKYQIPNPYSLKVDQKVKVKVTRSKVISSNERSGHEVSICEISKPNPL